MVRLRTNSYRAVSCQKLVLLMTTEYMNLKKSQEEIVRQLQIYGRSEVQMPSISTYKIQE